ncbi:DUF4007 family protein [Mesorhizobium sp.]|uniref:DUF4007 family protein n=1 Tax=Mesorhizobium sp. TaxID=1871066 RepID=UPI000FE7095E|nr:DUF4007 family protein [Mesorhizobium sp.]RWP03127.1 MAG: DUF4007 family protein [Mesorhizobium sp.]
METFLSGEFRPQFAGHETFPVRTLWLKKAFDAVAQGADKSIFTAPDAIVRFGVGKNMAQAMRHWLLASGFAREEGALLRPTALGTALLSDDGLDPYLEQAASLWMLHLALAGAPDMTTTWYWAFNIYGSLTFDRDAMTRGLLQLAEQRGWKRVAPVTVKRDVDCFIRSYVSRTRGTIVEDAIEPVLVELGLIRSSVIGDAFEFVRGPKASLPDAVFAIALDRFWRATHSEASTLSIEAACYGHGSPGRVFKLDEESVVDRLIRIADITHGALSWSETAGLMQVVRTGSFDEAAVFERGNRTVRSVAA